MDISTWVAIGSVFVALGSAVFAWGSWREAKRSADASERSATAAEEANAIQRAGLTVGEERNRQARSAELWTAFDTKEYGGDDATFRLRIENRGSYDAMDVTAALIVDGQVFGVGGVTRLGAHREAWRPSFRFSWLHPEVKVTGEGGGRPFPVLPEKAAELRITYTDGNGGHEYQRTMVWGEGAVNERGLRWEDARTVRQTAP